MTDYWMHIGSGRITSSSGKDIGVFTGDFRYRDQLIVAVNAESELLNEIASLKAQLAECKMVISEMTKRVDGNTLDAICWREYQARKIRLTESGFGKSPLRDVRKD